MLIMESSLIIFAEHYNYLFSGIYFNPSSGFLSMFLHVVGGISTAGTGKYTQYCINLIKIFHR